MSKELMCILIARMAIKLNTLIVAKEYDLLDGTVLHYSIRLDRVLMHYNKSHIKINYSNNLTYLFKESWAV